MSAPASSSNPLRRYIHHGSSNSAQTSANGSKDQDAPWAVVTGATNGMGEQFAHQLAGLGFNVIIHGRSASKLSSVQKSIQDKHANAQVRTVVIDAGAHPPDFSALTAALSDARVTVLVNNVGVVSQNYPLLEEENVHDIASQISTNTVFPTILASVMLPTLKRNSPSLLINMASLGAWAPTPYISPYGGAKAYMLNFSRSLYNEMACEKQQVDVVCLAPGQVVSGMNEGPPTGMMPTSQAWVQKALSSLAPGFFSKRPAPVIIPWPAHAWAARAMKLMPRSLADSTVCKVTMDLRSKKRQSSKSSSAQSSKAGTDKAEGSTQQANGAPVTVAQASSESEQTVGEGEADAKASA